MKFIYTAKKIAILVSDQDYEYLNQFRWFVNANGYVVRWSKMKNGKRHWIKMSHEILPPLGLHIDHRDRNTLNHQRENLRRATFAQNAANSQRTSRSGLKGVYAHGRKWKVSITHNRKTIHVGVYETKEEASMIYDQRARGYFGEFARGNSLC